MTGIKTGGKTGVATPSPKDVHERVVRAQDARAKKQVQNAVTAFKGTVTSVSPLSVERHDTHGQHDLGDNLEMTQWVKLYDAAAGIKVGDTALVDRRGDQWYVVDIDSDHVWDYRPTGLMPDNRWY